MFSNNAVKGHLEAYTDNKVTIENTAQIGASFHDGWVPSIPSQYGWISKTPVPITAIVDGGGNDVMSVKDDCLQFNDHCKQQVRFWLWGYTRRYVSINPPAAPETTTDRRGAGHGRGPTQQDGRRRHRARGLHGPLLCLGS